MKNKYKIILIICIIIGICSILVGSIAYYRIVVEGSIKGSTGNAVFVLKDENSNVWNNKEINLGKVNPGDSGEFTVTMDASGSTVDMYATLELDRTNLPTNLKFYTTSDHKSELHKYYSFLETTNQTEALTIYWYWNPYISDEEDSKFINVESIEANIRVSAVQISEYAMMKNGVKANYETYEITYEDFWKDDYRTYIRTINFNNDLSNLPSNCIEENLCWDVSYDASQKKKVYGYLIDSGLTVSETDSSTSTITEKVLYNLYIVSEAPIFAPTGCDFMFEFSKYDSDSDKSISNLTQINFNNNFNTSKVTNMFYMFSGCSSLTSLDISSFNTSNVTNMAYMFNECQSLTSLDISSFNTSNVTNMAYVFNECQSLTSLDLSNFNTSKVTDMGTMFRLCVSLTFLNLKSFNTSNVLNMFGLFMACSSLTSLDLSNFNTSKVTDMYGMFSGCSLLTNLDLSSFNTSNITTYSAYSQESNGMFYNCSKLTTTINIMNANVTNYEYMFYNAATDPNAKITVNYIAAASTLVDNMIATKSSNSNVVKGTEL